MNGIYISIKFIFKAIIDELALWAFRGEVAVGGP